MLFDANFFKTMFNGFLKPTTYQSDLESYLETKNPQSPADVDHWVTQFDNERRARAQMDAKGQYY